MYKKYLYKKTRPGLDPAKESSTLCMRQETRYRGAEHNLLVFVLYSTLSVTRGWYLY
jgi:hypothetical protein